MTTPMTTAKAAHVLPAASAAVPRAPRLHALDWMRGLVMVLMTIDHASGAFNAGRLVTDAAFFYKPGTPLPAAQFLIRWITHLCAPTFVFLAGAALALSVERRLAAGERPGAIDRFILTRGLFIAALDPLWMTWVLFKPGTVLLQVLYAIGLSLVLMVPLRRLGTGWLLGLSLVLIAGGEALMGLAFWASGGQPPLPIGFLLTGASVKGLIVAYPVLPWLAMMMLGWALGRVFVRMPASGAARTAGWLAGAGVASLALFVAVRGLNGYGNLLLARDDGSLVQWLHVSKYPPSASFVLLELGLGALLLAGFFVVGRRAEAPWWTRPLLVFGQTALFFYVLHVHLLELAAWVLGMKAKGGIGETLVAAAAALVVLYPLCVWYGRYKRAHPNGWARYV